MEKEKTVLIKLPLTRRQKEDVFVGINGRTFVSQRGLEVGVPWNVAKVLERKEKVLSKAMAYEDAAAAPLEALEARG